jgi:hypothetical protein
MVMCRARSHLSASRFESVIFRLIDIFVILMLNNSPRLRFLPSKIARTMGALNKIGRSFTPPPRMILCHV